MAITYIATSVGNYIVLGLAADTKPTAVSGAIFLETDTGFIYKNIATVWTLVPFGGTAAWGAITGVLSVQTDLQSALDDKQASDADLTTLAGLTATTNNFIVSVASAWASRTPTQVKATLAIANTDVSGLGNLSTQNGTFSGTSSGTNTGDQTISDATITTTDITTNNASSTKHGFLPKLDNTGAKYLRDDGTWQTVVASAPDIALTKQAPTTDQTITAGNSAIVNRRFTVASGKKLTIGSGSIFRIH